MNIFKRKNASTSNGNQAQLAEVALKNIRDGVIITNKDGIIQFINPAGIEMTECASLENVSGLDYGVIVKVESKEGSAFSEAENSFVQAMKNGQPLDGFQCCLVVEKTGKRTPVSISVVVADGTQQSRIITMRDIAKELANEGEQTEFISTASHEMRTPVASIEGYLSLALNPQTATIDSRAKSYLEAAHSASKHLGQLFQDLLDVTKLDDRRIRPHFEPAEMVGMVKMISDDYISRAKDAGIKFAFGTADKAALMESRHIRQVVYGYVDPNFMREIMDNLIENALKYTPSGGSVYVNVRGDGDRVLINVTDTGIGISADDLGHIFQKFYRADNSDTRTIGGTGLGLYLVKQRVEAMGGKVWAESAFGEGSTFYVSLPRLTSDEYEKRMIAVKNQQAMEQQSANTTEATTLPPAGVPDASNPAIPNSVPDLTVDSLAAAQMPPATSAGPVIQDPSSTTATADVSNANAAPVAAAEPTQTQILPPPEAPSAMDLVASLDAENHIISPLNTPNIPISNPTASPTPNPAPAPASNPTATPARNPVPVSVSSTVTSNTGLENTMNQIQQELSQDQTTTPAPASIEPLLTEMSQQLAAAAPSAPPGSTQPAPQPPDTQNNNNLNGEAK